jgi:hypothetical protein
MRAAGDDAHILASMGKFGGQEAADRASADYAYPHEWIPFRPVRWRDLA